MSQPHRPDHHRPGLFSARGTVCLGALAAIAILSLIAGADAGRSARQGPVRTAVRRTTPALRARPAGPEALHRRRARSASATARAQIALWRAAGAKIMTGMVGAYPSSGLLDRVRAGEIGGVILFSGNVSPDLPAGIRALQHAARAAGDPPLVIATDQEGGPVRRLAMAPPALPPAEMSGDTEPQGAATAHALRDVGINTDLAPVADVAHPGDFLGTRTFSSSAVRVGASACGFARGLELGGVNATFKHFPGLGAALTSTDLQPTVVGASEPQLLTDLLPYQECRPRLVMVSNAVYPALGSEQPAVFSPQIVTGLLRDRLGFRGVTISDTLAAPGVSSPSAAVRATNAGIDMLLYTDQSESVRAYWNLRAAVADRLVSPDGILASARRIYALTR